MAIAFLLATLALPATAVGSQAAGNSLAITVHVGYQDTVKPQQWMPVSIDVKNSGPDIDGTLEVQATANQPGAPAGAVYQVPLSLASGATKHLRTYVVEEIQGSLSVTVRIVQNGRVMASQDAPSPSSVNTLIGVLSDQSTALDEFAAVHPAGIVAQVVHLHPQDLADLPVVLRGFDLLAIDDFATDSLTAGQRTAIADFVQTGGSLLVGTGAAWRKTLAGLPPAILPMQVGGTRTLASSYVLGGLSRVEVATGSITGGNAWLANGDQPLLVERMVGSGMVTMSVFDWNQEPVSGWSGSSVLLRQILMRSVFGSAPSQNYGMGMRPIGMMPQFGSSGASLSQRSNALAQTLGNLPALDLPSLQLTGLLVLIYVLLVGPVNYFVLGAVRRRALAWITIPVIAIVASAGAYGAGIATKGRSVQTNQVSIIHLEPGWDRAYQESYTGVLTPTRGDYQVAISGDRLLISSIASNSYFGGPSGGFGGPAAGTIRVSGDNRGVTLPGMTAFVLRGFATEGLTASPQLTGSVQLVNGNLTGTIMNHSSLTFTDAVLIAGDSYQTFGVLKPGASATVNLAPKLSTAFGAPTYMRIYPNNNFGGPQPNVTDAQREGQAKTQILSLLPTGGSFKGITSAIVPIFVAWTRQSVQDIIVSGVHPRSNAETAVVLPLPFDQLGPGALPAGVVTGRIVDVEGATQPGPPGAIMMQNGGTVTYEFAPGLAAGVHLTGASFTSANPYFGKGGPQGTSPPPAHVWDWSKSAWVDIAYQDNGTTSVPDSAINPISGVVRLQLGATSNAGFMAGTVSLTGSVQ